jgi:hypothetical protein
MPLPEDDYIDDADEEWVNKAPKGLRVPAVLGILVLLLFAVSGFWGGAVLQKHHDKSKATTTGASAFSALAAGRRGAAGAGGTTGTGTGTGGGTGANGGGFAGFGGGGAGGGGGGRTAGTVSDVEGSTVFVTDAAGSIVKVNLAATTKISKTTTASASDIQLGDTIVVTGAKGTDGSTAAQTITIAPAGTTIGGGGGSGGGAGGTGTGAGGTGTGAGGTGTGAGGTGGGG